MTRAIVIVMALLVCGCAETWYAHSAYSYPMERLGYKNGYNHYRITMQSDPVANAHNRLKWIRWAMRDEGCDPETTEVIECKKLSTQGSVLKSSRYLYTVRAKPISLDSQ